MSQNSSRRENVAPAAKPGRAGNLSPHNLFWIVINIQRGNLRLQFSNLYYHKIMVLSPPYRASAHVLLGVGRIFPNFFCENKAGTKAIQGNTWENTVNYGIFR
jgi:hypothetical protein